MADLSACPKCRRRASKSLTANWFPVYTCRDCRQKSCSQCGGTKCPSCGSTRYSELDKVYAR